MPSVLGASFRASMPCWVGKYSAGLGEQAVEVPFLVEVRRAVGTDHGVDGRREHVDRPLAQILALHYLDTPGVDHLALLVHNLVVLEHVLADLGVANFDVVLSPLDGLGDHAVFDRDVLGEAGPWPTARSPVRRAA